MDTARYPHATCRSINFSSSSVGASTDWDPGFFKGECAAGEHVAGVAQTSGGAVTHILCCSGAIAKSSCSRLPVGISGNSGESGSLGWGWDDGVSLTECGPSRYVAGVSRNSSTGLPHALYCCSP